MREIASALQVFDGGSFLFDEAAERSVFPRWKVQGMKR